MQHRDALGDLAHERMSCSTTMMVWRPFRLLTITEVLCVSAWSCRRRLVEQDDLRVWVIRSPNPALGLAMAEIGGDPTGLFVKPISSSTSSTFCLALAPKEAEDWRNAGLLDARHFEIEADGQFLEHARDLNLRPSPARAICAFPVGDVVSCRKTRPEVDLVLP